MYTTPPLLNALAFQGGWFACVLGGNGWALAALSLLLPLHIASQHPRARAALAILCCAAVGIALDLAWQAAGLLTFRGAMLGPLPPWLAALWLLFACTLGHSLAWLRGRPWLAALLGALAGPLSYVAGLELGAAQSTYPGWQVAIALAPAWALLLPLLSRLEQQVAGR